jgi:hypothetical protein
LSLAIITIHKGKFANLLKTIKSVDIQKKKPSKHIIIARCLSNIQLKYINSKFKTLIHNKDKSIYNAMNIGLKITKKNHLLFLNSGDCFVNKNITEYIYNLIKKEKKCLIFKTQIVYKNKYYIPKNNFFLSNNYFPHPSFVRPPVKKELIIFDESFKIISDGIWMKNHLNNYNFKKIDMIIAQHHIGGISSVPSLDLLKDKIKISFFQFLTEFVKLVLYYLLKDKYFYHFILKKNFEKL